MLCVWRVYVMRASKVIDILRTELESKDEHIDFLLRENSRLTAALVAAEGKPAAAAALRPRKEEPAEKPPLTRPIGL